MVPSSADQRSSVLPVAMRWIIKAESCVASMVPNDGARRSRKKFNGGLVIS
jgi:hypothetical protein